MTAPDGAGTSEDRTIGARGAAAVGVASVVSAAAGYAVLALAAQSLGAGMTTFLTFWSALFLVLGVLGGVQNETTRAVRSAAMRDADAERAPRTGARTATTGLAVGGVLAVVVAASGVLWAPHLFGPGWPQLLAALTVGGALFSGHAAVAGALAGAREWVPYATLVACEAAGRALLAGAVLLLGAATVGLAWGSALATGAWLLVAVFSPRTRAALTTRVDVARRTLLRSTGHAMVAAASSATLVVGFTVLLRLTTPAAEFDAAAPLILGVTVTRAPLLLPLLAYQGVAITYLLTHRERLGVALARVVAAICAAAAVAAAGAATVGPPLMLWVFEEAGEIGGGLLAALVAAAAALAVVTITGAAALAAGEHRRYAVGWFVATATTVAVLLTDLPIGTRTVVGLVVGPLVGVAVHVRAITHPSRALPDRAGAGSADR